MWKSYYCSKRSLFRYIKSFDHVWHDGIIFKLKAYGAEGELLPLLKNKENLENRQQRIVLNGQISEWKKKIMTGVPQGLVLGPLLLFNNHKWSSWWSRSIVQKIIAEDTSLFSNVYDIHKLAIKLNDDLEKY